MRRPSRRKRARTRDAFDGRRGRKTETGHKVIEAKFRRTTWGAGLDIDVENGGDHGDGRHQLVQRLRPRAPLAA